VDWLPTPALIGVVHLPPLPGSPRTALPVEHIVERAVAESRLLVDAGFDAVVIENFGDAPFHGERVEVHTAVAMGVVTRAVVSAAGCPVGVNVLRNDARSAMAIASMTGARFIRVNVHTGVYATDQGMLEGRAADTLRYRSMLSSDVAIFADIDVKHARPLAGPNLSMAAEETAYRGLADALIVTGPTTGRPAERNDIEETKQAVPDRPVLVGSGVTAESVASVLAAADGVIVGTALKEHGRTEAPLDRTRVAQFVRAAGR